MRCKLALALALATLSVSLAEPPPTCDAADHTCNPRPPVDLSPHPVAQGLLRSTARLPIRVQAGGAAPRKVAVAYGVCVDAVVPAALALAALGVDGKAPIAAVHHAGIASVQQLAETLAYFLSRGAAGERFVPSREVFGALTAAVDGLEKVAGGTTYNLGGNAGVIGGRLGRLGGAVLLGARVSEKAMGVAPAPPRSMKVAPGVMGEGFVDDIHVILEWQVGEEWGGHVSPRANRFAVHSDLEMPQLQSLQGFNQQLKGFGGSMLVLGGFQVMDGVDYEPPERRQQLLAEVAAGARAFSAQRGGNRVHLELASFADNAFIGDLQTHLFPEVHSMGMNEQELHTLHSFLLSGEVSLASEARPRVAESLDKLRDIFAQATAKAPKLQRLHLHTLGAQFIVQSCAPDPRNVQSKYSCDWPRMRSAAALASLSATKYTCADDDASAIELTPFDGFDFDNSSTFLLLDGSFSSSLKDGDRRKVSFTASEPTACWVEGDKRDGDEDELHFCVAPQLVCRKPTRTIGAGDVITASGLAAQL